MNRTERLRQALTGRRGEYQAIVDDTGLRYFWLSKFGRGVIADPGASKLDALEAWLRDHPPSGAAAAAEEAA